MRPTGRSCWSSRNARRWRLSIRKRTGSPGPNDQRKSPGSWRGGAFPGRGISPYSSIMPALRMRTGVFDTSWCPPAESVESVEVVNDLRRRDLRPSSHRSGAGPSQTSAHPLGISPPNDAPSGKHVSLWTSDIAFRRDGFYAKGTAHGIGEPSFQQRFPLPVITTTDRAGWRRIDDHDTGRGRGQFLDNRLRPAHRE